MRMPLRAPSSRMRGSRKHDSPPGACASTRKASDIGAEQNHLWPFSTYRPSPIGVAVVVFARTSEPPCFSVIAMPNRALCLPALSSGSYVVLNVRRSHSS